MAMQSHGSQTEDHFGMARLLPRLASFPKILI